MALFYAASRRNSVFLLRFRFLGYRYVFLQAISQVSCSEYLYNCFFSDFCTLVLLLFTVILKLP